MSLAEKLLRILLRLAMLLLFVGTCVLLNRMMFGVHEVDIGGGGGDEKFLVDERQKIPK